MGAPDTLLTIYVRVAYFIAGVRINAAGFVHLGSGNRVLPSAFSYRNSQAASFAFRGGFGKYK
jgi:hypothetical protein